MTRSTSTRTIAALVVAGALAVGLGALVSAATDDPSTTRSLPSSGVPIPVIGPSDGALGPGAAPAADGGAGGGGGSGGGGAASDPVGLVEEYDVAVPAAAGGHAVRFVDPCADEEGGGAADGEADACAGVGSTVLSIVDAPPFEIRFAGVGCNRDQARPDPFPLGWLVQVNTTTPGDFVLTLTDTDDPTNVRTARASTSAAQAAEWEASESGLPSGVFTCAGFDLPNQSNQFSLTIEGRHGDETDTLTQLVAFEGTGGRPPVQVDVPRVPHEDELHVVVPSKHGDQGAVQVQLIGEREEIGLGGPNYGDACPEVRFDAVTRPSDTSPVPGAELEADGYPYDQGWDHRFEHTFTSATDFRPGGRYELCIFWLDGAHRVQEKVVYPIVTPNRYAVFVRVTKVAFTHPQVPSSYEVSAFDGRCTIRPGGVDQVRSRTYGADATVRFPGMYSAPGTCNHDDGLAVLPGSTFAAGSFEPLLRVEVNGHGREIVDYLRLPLSSCARRTGYCGEYPNEYSHTITETRLDESYVIGLGHGSGGGLCGSSFGDCDPPRERVGTITVQVRFVETDRQGGRSWDVGPPVPITRS